MIATPGPVVAFVLNAAARGGFKQALWTVLGTNWASLILIASAALMIMGLVTINNELLSWISLAGCIFLGWIAIDGLRNELNSTDNTNIINNSSEPIIKAGGIKQILYGFLIGISNPKDIIFFVSFFPQFINITSHVEISLIVLAALWILCDFLILLSYAILINSKKFLHHQKWISILSSGFLLIVAIGAGIYTLMKLQH